VRVETNKTLLKPEYKHYLNPIQINLTDIEVIEDFLTLESVHRCQQEDPVATTHFEV